MKSLSTTIGTESNIQREQDSEHQHFISSSSLQNMNNKNKAFLPSYIEIKPLSLNRRQRRTQEKLSQIISLKKSNNKTLISPLSVFKRKRKERIQREEIFYTGETPIRSNILLEKQPLQAILDSGSSLNIINEVL